MLSVILMINELEIYDMMLLEIEQRIHVLMKQSFHSSKHLSGTLHEGNFSHSDPSFT